MALPKKKNNKFPAFLSFILLSTLGLSACSNESESMEGTENQEDLRVTPVEVSSAI